MRSESNVGILFSVYQRDQRLMVITLKRGKMGEKL
jgi:hypothetical protein